MKADERARAQLGPRGIPNGRSTRHRWVELTRPIRRCAVSIVPPVDVLGGSGVKGPHELCTIGELRRLELGAGRAVEVEPALLNDAARQTSDNGSGVRAACGEGSGACCSSNSASNSSTKASVSWSVISGGRRWRANRPSPRANDRNSE